ncbi:MAG: sigma-70 family RNA polymerase sigma factor [Verrucomicrobiota bacterium]
MKVRTQGESTQLAGADVVKRAQQGDAAAFEHIYRLHSRRVYSLCLRMAGNPTDAEDLTQDVFLQLFRKIGTFRGESAFSTWLHRMSVNIVLMRFRKKPKGETSLETVTNQDEDSSGPAKEFGGADLRLDGVIDRVALQAAISELAPGFRAMFILHYVQGYKHNEIARILGCTTGNSKSQTHKARIRLRELLRKTLLGSEHERGEASSDSLELKHPELGFNCADA